jgi:regulator of sigma E protease
MITFILTLIVTLAILVLFHETGHFLAAKAVGLRVHEFAFGFGPQLLRIGKRNETEYTVHAIPAGGYVRIAGMDPGEEEESDGYYSKPYWQRAVVLLAGPFMNFLLAVLIFCAMGPIVGLPEQKATDYVMVGSVGAGSEAERVGLHPGDKIFGIVGIAKGDPDKIISTIHKSAGKELTLEVRRDGKVLTVRGTPEEKTQGGRTYGAFGFVPQPEIIFVRTGLLASARTGIEKSAELARMVIRLLLSRAIAAEAGGPVAIGYATYEAYQRGFAEVAFLLAIISVNLAVVNLLPIPILDGGHLLMMGVEKTYGAVRKGGKLSPNTIYALQAFGLVLILSLVLMLTYRDISRILSGQMP